MAHAREPGLAAVARGQGISITPLRSVAFFAILAGLGPPAGAAAQTGQAGTTPIQTYRGLEMSVTAVERASSAALSDCPPGANTQKAMARPGQGFAIVKVQVRVLPGYEPAGAPLRRPVLTDRAGKLYNTAASFVDLGKVPEFTCAFPFRIPEGTQLKSIQIDSVAFDLTSFEPKARGASPTS